MVINIDYIIYTCVCMAISCNILVIYSVYRNIYIYLYTYDKSIVFIHRWLLLLEGESDHSTVAIASRDFSRRRRLSLARRREGGFTMGTGRCSEGGLEVQQRWVIDISH